MASNLEGFVLKNGVIRQFFMGLVSHLSTRSETGTTLKYFMEPVIIQCFSIAIENVLDLAETD